MAITVIKNARIVNEGNTTEGDLKIRDGRIDTVGARIATPAGASEIDANGAYLIPGMIDDQVHFREPGFEHKGTIATESKAAIAGGVTSYMEMPNCNPQTITHAALRDKHARAARVSLANYGFYFGATNDNLEVVKTVDPMLACGVKVFMGASTGNMLVDNPATLEGIFSEHAAADRDALRRHADHSGERSASTRAVRRRHSGYRASEHPLGGSVLQVVVDGRGSREAPRHAAAHSSPHHRTRNVAVRARLEPGQAHYR